MHFTNAKGILSAHNGMNIYRGCQHGCIYCDARSKCYNMQHQFEDIEVKQNALTLLENSLKSKRKLCMIGTGSMSDPYIPLESNLQMTRKSLELIEKYGYGVAIQTKSADIIRDIDILDKINKKAKAVVQITLTTFDENLCKILEPNVSTTKERYNALKILQQHNIPTVVWLCPFLPMINDTKENIQGLLNYCVDAKVKGIICFGIGVTLREGNREYFYKKLDNHFKGLKSEYIKRYGNSYELVSDNSKRLMDIIYNCCKQNNIMYGNSKVFEYLHTFEFSDQQLSLF